MNGLLKNKDLAKFYSNSTSLLVSFFERFRTSRSLECFTKPFWGLNFGLTIQKLGLAEKNVSTVSPSPKILPFAATPRTMLEGKRLLLRVFGSFEKSMVREIQIPVSLSSLFPGFLLDVYF